MFKEKLRKEDKFFEKIIMNWKNLLEKLGLFQKKTKDTSVKKNDPKYPDNKIRVKVRYL